MNCYKIWFQSIHWSDNYLKKSLDNTCAWNQVAKPTGEIYIYICVKGTLVDYETFKPSQQCAGYS